jgi:hypothetical protein
MEAKRADWACGVDEALEEYAAGGGGGRVWVRGNPLKYRILKFIVGGFRAGFRSSDTRIPVMRPVSNSANNWRGTDYWVAGGGGQVGGSDWLLRHCRECIQRGCTNVPNEYVGVSATLPTCSREAPTRPRLQLLRLGFPYFYQAGTRRDSISITSRSPSSKYCPICPSYRRLYELSWDATVS